MLFLFGERVHAASIDAGRKPCGVCKAETDFIRVVESSWFCVFGLRLLKIETVADYLECSRCNLAFGADTSMPAHLPVLQKVLVYILLGYGMHEHRELAREICSKITGFEMTDDALTQLMRAVDAGTRDIFDALRRDGRSLNARGKHQVVQAAFLMTHVCCEIQHEDRVRINLIGNALGVPLAFVGDCIEAVRSRGYYGVRRILPTRA